MTGLQDQTYQAEGMSEETEREESSIFTVKYETAPLSTRLEYSHDVSLLDPDGPRGQPRVVANFSRLQTAPWDLTAADAAVTTLHMYSPDALDMFLSRSNKHVMWECHHKITAISLLIIRNLGIVNVSQQEGP
jgi:hypothetical protein